MALCRAGRMAVVVRGHSEQFGRDAVALVESASFPNGQVVADLGISRSSLQAWLREGRLASRGLSHWPAHTRSRRHGPRQGPTADAPLGPTCARQRPMERQNGRPQHRPAGGFRLVSQRAVDSPPGWGRRLAQSFTCDRGSQSRTAAFTAMITTHEPGLFHGSRRRRRPGRSHGDPSFRPPPEKRVQPRRLGHSQPAQTGRSSCLDREPPVPQAPAAAHVDSKPSANSYPSNTK